MASQQPNHRYQREVFKQVRLLTDGELDQLITHENNDYPSPDFVKGSGYLAAAGLVEPPLDDVRFDPNRDEECGPTVFGEVI